MAGMFGCSIDELLSRPVLDFVYEEDRAMMAENVRKRLSGEVESIHYALRALRKDGAIIHVEAHGGRMEYNGRPAILGTLLDITQQRSLEEQLRHSQKMEAIGLLAGGVAHDFNNILTVICGYAQMLLKEENPESERREPLEEILVAAERARRLTRQLLTFGRKQMGQPKTLELHEVIHGMAGMLQRVMGEDVVLRVDCAPERLFVHADAGMLEQVLMNLSVNARDAMPQGERLTITTRQETVGAGSPRLHPRAYPGDFVLLRVSDTGCGISPEVMNRMFEPFFTTKAPGKGTGLGLATVHSIAQQHRGWIEVESVVGEGSAFSMFLPAIGRSSEIPAPQPPVPRAMGGTETILVVDDEPGIRRLVTTVLRRRGYRMIEAASGAEALALWRTHGAETGLVITDMIMPDGMTGAALADALCALKPQLKVVFTSGYCAEEVRGGRLLEEGVNFLRKPYLPEQLAKVVRQSLDS
jgi:two-component system cell cycle sensor histidine kinase/response regulator CckA